MSAESRPRSFSLRVQAPDNWVPVVEEGSETISVDEVVSESVLRVFAESRFEHRYLAEARQDTFASSSDRQETFVYGETAASRLNVPYDERGQTEVLELLEEYQDGLNVVQIIDRFNERFAVRESSTLSTQIQNLVQEQIVFNEVRTVRGTVGEARSESFTFSEQATSLIGISFLYPEFIPVAETRVSNFARMEARAELAVFGEAGIANRGAAEAVPETPAFGEAASSATNFVVLRTESLAPTEVPTSQISFNVTRTETLALLESRNDILNRVGEEFGPETVVFSETGSERAGATSIRTESVGAWVEAAQTTMAWTSTRSETPTFLELRTDILTFAVTWSFPETITTAEAATSRISFTQTVTEPLGFSELNTYGIERLAIREDYVDTQMLLSGSPMIEVEVDSFEQGGYHVVETRTEFIPLEGEGTANFFEYLPDSHSFSETGASAIAFSNPRAEATTFYEERNDTLVRMFIETLTESLGLSSP